MTRALLDVNVLLALIDPDHVEHRRAHAWLATEGRGSWASCAITENGAVRILSQPAYPHPISLFQAIEVLARTVQHADHEFWPADVSLLDQTIVEPSRVLGPKQVTDTYLLALAVAHAGTFATFDRAIPLTAVHGAEPAHLSVIE